jgi:hypothetical protein
LINPSVDGCGKIVPFAEFFRVSGIEMLLPALDKKLWMRGSNKQGLCIGTSKQLALPPDPGAKHAIHDWSLSLWDEPDSLMDRRMWSCLKEEKLIQPQAQNITKIGIDP